jgi:hypothetical protein
MKKFPKINLV